MTPSQKNSLSPQIQSTIGAIFSALLLLFAISHLSAFAETGMTNKLLFSLAEIVVAVLVLLWMPMLENRDEAVGFDSEELGANSSVISEADINGLCRERTRGSADRHPGRRPGAASRGMTNVTSTCGAYDY
ncbi:hypothetical protein GPA23_14990 [Aromatoleum aromaticum]|nr:hypothetical protein [Aromatoleum aromaticum]